ncbi:MAG: hypothetical protein ACR2Q4_10925 [Geminicoccaceae bacterium]
MRGLSSIGSGILTSLLVWTVSADVRAGELPERWKRAEFAVGGYLATFGSDLRIDGNDGNLGTVIDLENTLNLDSDRYTFWLDGYWRFFDRHRLELSYYDVSREGTRTLNEQVVIRDEVFDIGVSVASSIDLKVGKIAYAYSILQNDQWDGSLSLGVSAFDFQTSIQARIDGVGSTQRSTSELFAPLPTVGARLWYAFADDWTARLEGNFFALEFDEYNGSLIDAEAAIDYDVTDWFGLTLGYNYVNIDVDRTGGDFDAAIRYQYSAIILAARRFLN